MPEPRVTLVAHLATRETHVNQLESENVKCVRSVGLLAQLEDCACSLTVALAAVSVHNEQRDGLATMAICTSSVSHTSEPCIANT